jgi:A/G-specific adenine glycosylase
MEDDAVAPAARDAIMAWYDARGRSLAFRGTRDPYAILVSEVMAQQTQVSRVAPAWSAFLAAFPTVADLAAAPTADVIRAWRGLGYNRRAVNLQRAARLMVEEHRGRVPSEVAALERLPGVGPYTARAVAALAYGTPVGAVDTNVRRVLERMVGSPGMPPRRLQALADAVVPPSRPATWTHAVMDLGATLCRPARPRCDECPARRWCRSANRAGRSRRARTPAKTAFTSTSRWLRGRIVDRLRAASDGEWTAFRGPLGEHDEAAVRRALLDLQHDGLVVRHPTDATRARLAGQDVQPEAGRNATQQNPG